MKIHRRRFASVSSQSSAPLPEDVLITTIRIDQSSSDFNIIISTIEDNGALSAIRDHSHRYLGKYTDINTMSVCQLLDSNSGKFYDGTTATLTGTMGDVYMKLPKFWYKSQKIDNNIWDISFIYYEGNESIKGGFIEWAGNDLIGAYESYNESGKARSISGKAPTGTLSLQQWRSYVRVRGEGFSMVRWRHHNIMAFLFLAYYKNTNSQAICGIGTKSSGKTTGMTNSLGMNDSLAANVDNKSSINFWGLDNWWGNKYEWMEDVLISSDNVFSIVDENNRIIRTIGQGAAGAGTITKLLIGQYMDALPVEIAEDDTYNIGYCDEYWDTDGVNNCVIMRANTYNYLPGGVFFIHAGRTETNAYSAVSSRIAFTGNIIEITDVNQFKSLTEYSGN